MKFKRTLTSRATIQKKETYDFDKEFTKEELLEGTAHNFDSPLFLDKEGCWYALYKDDSDNLLCIVMLHSYDKFREIK